MKAWINIRRLVLAVLGICILGTPQLSAQAANVVGSFAGHPLYDNAIEGAEITEGGSSTISRRGVAATTYDPRVNHMVSQHIEDQGDTNTCWAFSVIAAVECNLIKKGYETETVNLSENHLAYFFYNRQADPLGYTAGDQNINSLSRNWAQNGGTLQGTALALTTWAGVVKETASEDDATGAYLPTSLPASSCYLSDYRVANTYFYNYSVDTVKQAIMDYGAVASGVYMDEKYWNISTGAYYCPESGGNHAIAIVGWDDTYSRDNFKTKPGQDGAWIVKNSYGTQLPDGTVLGDQGYLYISYEDASLSEIVAFDMVPATESYAHNYQYDGTANPAQYWSFSSGTTYAAVFQATGSAQGYNELLKAVSVDVLTTNVSYSLQIYTGVTGTQDPKNGVAAFNSPQTGTLVNAGYNQITLQTPVTVTAGERYAVVIKLGTSNGAMVRLGCEGSYNASWIRFVANVGAGQSYVYTGDTWYDFGSVADVGATNLSNLRIKAYTDDTTELTSYSLSQTKLGLSKGSSKRLSVLISPSTVRRDIVWTSSNAKVATVHSNGRVKGKKYGTATIQAQFVTGAGEQTLKCKVTVGPAKMKKFKVKGGNGKLTVTWSRNTAAKGYVIYYATEENGTYRKLATITKQSKKKYVKKHLAAGTYYVKMQPYIKQKGKTLYGSETAVKKVTVR